MSQKDNVTDEYSFWSINLFKELSAEKRKQDESIFREQ